MTLSTMPKWYQYRLGAIIAISFTVNSASEFFGKKKDHVNWQRNRCQNRRKALNYHGNDGIPYGIRTRVAAVKGRCPKPLDERDASGMMLIYPNAPPKSSLLQQKNAAKAKLACPAV